MGEETNKLVGYLAAVSRKLDKPLGVVIQSSSAAGKTSLMDAVLAFMPDEETRQVLGDDRAEPVLHGRDQPQAQDPGDRRGGRREPRELRLEALAKRRRAHDCITGKDPQTGNLVTQQYRVEGPVMMFLTTTAREIDEELMNRCLVLAVDEGREQTRAIHDCNARAARSKACLPSASAKP